MLENVIIGKNLMVIEEEAFYECRSLKSITIPEGVTSIGRNAFYWCSSLDIIHNNSNLELTLGSYDNGCVAYYADAICDKNGNITYKKEKNDEMEYLYTYDDFLFQKDSSGEYSLISYLGTNDTITLPIDINGSAYEITMKRSAKNVIIPNGIVSIEDNAFSNCWFLESITIPDSVTSIGNRAFSSCKSLESITIPDSVISIGERAFYDCSSLTSITIPDSVISIGDEAFADCTSLTSITIPDSVTSIGDRALIYCNSLVDITFDGTKDEWKAIKKGSSWDSFTGYYTVHCTDGDIKK